MYQLTQNPNIILRLSDNAQIPADPLNPDYQAYLAWVAGGNTATAAAAVANFDTGLGWHIAYDAASRALLAQGETLINTEVQSLQLAGNSAGVTTFLASNFTFVDVNGTPHVVTVSQAMAINLAYGQAYQQIWDAEQ